MCIRDSFLIARDQVGGLRRLLDLLHRRKMLTDAYYHDACDSLAVSYTHLRAHETVLDLVCRLLLEKKKAQK